MVCPQGICLLLCPASPPSFYGQNTHSPHGSNLVLFVLVRACVCVLLGAGWLAGSCLRVSGACEGCGPRKEHHHAPHLQEGGDSAARAEAAQEEGRGPAGRQDEASGGEGGHRDALPKGAGGARGRGRGKAKASPAEATPAQRARQPTKQILGTSRLWVSPTHYSTA